MRTALLARATGGPSPDEPYESLARQIRDASHELTDAQVEAVRNVAGDDKSAFEIIMCACIGPGLARWEAAMRAIDEADDASA